MSIRSRIAAGVAFLNRVSPDWHWRVNTRKLAMEYESRCVLGQLYGEYTKALDRFEFTDKEAYKLGFCSIFQRRWDLSKFLPFVGRRLTKAWKKEIMARREQDRFQHAMDRLPEYKDMKCEEVMF